MTAYRVYLAGPMRGLPEHNYPAFNELQDWIADQGIPALADYELQIVNPARNFNGDRSRPYAEYMRKDIAQLAKCHGIVLLPGWEQSEGARLEVEVASHMRLDAFEAERSMGSLLPGWEIGEITESFGYAERDRAEDAMRADAEVKFEAPELIEEEAARLVRNGARQKNYGHPRGDFDTIAALWSPILGIKVTAEHVALCMIALKLARLTSNPKHHDSLVDVIGYAICYDRLDEEQ